MSRVTESEVQGLFPETVGNLSEAVKSATLFIDEELANAGLSVARLKLIELYLAGHFAALINERGGLTRLEVGETLKDYSNVYGEGLKMTRWGLQALAMDPSGILATHGKRTAVFRVV